MQWEEKIIIYKKYVPTKATSQHSHCQNEEFVVSGIKFLYASVKQVCHLWAQTRFDTFHQLSLLLKCYDPNQFFK
jgi:hypothetical protein